MESLKRAAARDAESCSVPVFSRANDRRALGILNCSGATQLGMI